MESNLQNPTFVAVKTTGQPKANTIVYWIVTVLLGISIQISICGASVGVARIGLMGTGH